MNETAQAHLGEALGTDFFSVRDQFTHEQWDRFSTVRKFVDSEVIPVAAGYWERAEMPWELIRRLPELGVVGEDIEGYGCAGMSPLACGLVTMELHRGDGSLSVALGVHAGLAKMHNTRKARALAADARDMLGGNGILLDNHVMRHLADLEAVHTFEGTETMQTLIVGRDITGISAFS